MFVYLTRIQAFSTTEIFASFVGFAILYITIWVNIQWGPVTDGNQHAQITFQWFLFFRMFKFR